MGYSCSLRYNKLPYNYRVSPSLLGLMLPSFFMSSSIKPLAQPYAFCHNTGSIIKRMAVLKGESMKPSETLRAVLEASNMSINAIAQASGVEQSSLHRFTTGERGLLLMAVDKLAEYFGLELVQEIVWDQYIADVWSDVADGLWKEYEPEAWRDALASGEWQEADYDAWKEEEYAGWAINMRDLLEADERERLHALPWVRIVED